MSTQYKLRMLILTKSYKHKGYCVAGINLFNGKFARVVSDRDGEALSREMTEGFSPLDVVEFAKVEYLPRSGPQSENFLLVEPCTLSKEQSIPVEGLWKIYKAGRVGNGNNARKLDLDNPAMLFEGRGGYIFSEDIKKVKRSLALIYVNNLIIKKREVNGKTSFRASFVWRLGTNKPTISAEIAVTDPDYYKECGIRRALIVISTPNLGWDSEKSEESPVGLYYEFLAKIFDLKSVRGEDWGKYDLVGESQNEISSGGMF